MHRAVWAIGIFATIGCGPSFQALYEGDARFEHCYALEDSGSGTMQHRADCWRDWIDHYTYGQTRDRVQYASNRYKVLTSTSLPTDEGMMSAAPGAGEENSTGAPAPTNAFAPPPTTASAQAGAAPGSTWMLTAPQQVLPDPPRDAGPPAVQGDGGAGATMPATATSAINPTVLPPPPPPPMKPRKKKT